MVRPEASPRKRGFARVWRTGLLVLLVPLALSYHPEAVVANATSASQNQGLVRNLHTSIKSDDSWEAAAVPMAYRPTSEPVPTHTSLWRRLQAGFQMHGEIDHPKVQQEIRYLLRHGNL